MYDATGALKIKTLGTGGLGGGGSQASMVNSIGIITIIHNVEKNPFQQRRGTQGEDGGEEAYNGP